MNVEHRLPGVTLAPAAMQNGWCAARWVVRNADLYGFDVNKIVVSGQSSGGWAALTTAMAPKGLGWKQACPGREDVKVAAVVNWYGVSDPVDSLARRNPGVEASLRGLPSPVEVAKAISLVHLVRPSGPLVISIHGDLDNSVPYAQSVQLHDTLKKVGVTEELIAIPRGGHCGFSRAVTQKAYAAIEGFLRVLALAPCRPVSSSSERRRSRSSASIPGSRAATAAAIKITMATSLRSRKRMVTSSWSTRHDRCPLKSFHRQNESSSSRAETRASHLSSTQGHTKGTIAYTNGKYLRMPRIE